MRMGHPHPILEFQWPIGKEVPQDVRRLTVSEFYLAVQLAAKCVRTAKGEEPVVQVNPQLYAELKQDFEEQLKEVNGEIAILKELLQEQSQEESQPQPQPQPQQQPQQQPQPQPQQQQQKQKQRGRPRKVQFT
jgi:hypothetical protein